MGNVFSMDECLGETSTDKGQQCPVMLAVNARAQSIREVYERDNVASEDSQENRIKALQEAAAALKAEKAAAAAAAVAAVEAETTAREPPSTPFFASVSPSSIGVAALEQVEKPVDESFNGVTDTGSKETAQTASRPSDKKSRSPRPVVQVVRSEDVEAVAVSTPAVEANAAAQTSFRPSDKKSRKARPVVQVVRTEDLQAATVATPAVEANAAIKTDFRLSEQKSGKPRPVVQVVRTEDLQAAAVGNPAVEANVAGGDAAEAAAGAFPPGVVVELHGLQAKPELNGRKGTVVGFDPALGRFAVRLLPGPDEKGAAKMTTKQVVQAKPSNLKRSEEEDSDSAGPHAGDADIGGRGEGRAKKKNRNRNRKKKTSKSPPGRQVR